MPSFAVGLPAAFSARCSGSEIDASDLPQLANGDDVPGIAGEDKDGEDVGVTTAGTQPPPQCGPANTT